MPVKPRIEWLTEALQDLDRLFDFIEPINPVAAEKIYGLLANAPFDLQQHPELGQPWDEDNSFREYVIPFGARAYVIRYKYIHDTILIARIWHGLENR